MFLGLLGCAALLPAQSRLVDLNVVALDKEGNPVADLMQDEFRVTDSGKPQEIAFFRSQDRGQWRTPPLQPGETSNRTAATIPHATVILFDLMNEDFSSRGVATNELVRDLESLENADYVYLYLLTLDGRLAPVRALPAQSGDVPPPSAEPWTRQIKPLLDQAMRAVLQVRREDIDIAIRVQLTYRALEALAADLSRVPGRKNVVWITDGVPIELGPVRSDTGDFVDFTPMLRQLSEALDQSSVAIYPVREIMLGSPDTVEGGRSGIGSIETLDEFAGLTGGRSGGVKDIAGAIRQAIADARRSYQIGYYPPEKNWDNKMHKLRVTCTRKGVRLQSKTEYYAWREPPGVRATEAIRTAAETSLDAAEIGLWGKVERGPAGEPMGHLQAHVDARDLVFVRQDAGYGAQLRLAILVSAPGAPPEVSPAIPMDLHFSAAERDRALQNGVAIDQDVPLAAATNTARLIVFDRNSNTVGSLTMPVPAAAPKPAR